MLPRISSIILLAIVLMALANCTSKNGAIEAQTSLSEEELVLRQSSFYPGEAAAPVRAREGITGGESGTIQKPGQSGSGNDGGFIPKPTSNPNESAQNSGTQTQSGGASSPTTASNSDNPASPSGSSSSDSTGSSPSSAGTVTSENSGSTNSSGQTASNTADKDSGFIPGSGSSTGGDSGSIAPANPSGSGSSSGNTSASNGSNDGSSSTGSPSDTEGNPSDAGSSSVGNTAQNGSGTENPGSSGSGSQVQTPGANDSGSIPPKTGSNQNDSGQVANNNSSNNSGNSQSDSGQSSTPGGTGNSNSSTGSNSGNTAGNTPSGNSSGGNSGTVAENNASGSSTTGPSSPSGNDGGKIPSVSPAPKADGGKTPPKKTLVELLKDIIKKLQDVAKGDNSKPPKGSGTTHAGNNVGGTSGNPGSNPGSTVQNPRPTPATVADNGQKPGCPSCGGCAGKSSGTCGSCQAGCAKCGSCGASSCSNCGACATGACSKCGPCQKCLTQAPSDFLLTLSRVCSVRRSQTEYLFFEEAENPVASVEATVYFQNERHGSRAQYASAGYASYPQHGGSPNGVRVLLQKVLLRGVDLFKGRHSSELRIDTTELKQKFPLDWENALVSVRVCDDTNNDGFCSDEKPYRHLSIQAAAFTADHIPRKLTLDVWNGRNLTLKSDPGYCEKQYSPLVLDLNGDGIQLTSAEAGTYFDLNDTGEKIPTGWVAGSDNAFLVRDLNDNGRIDSGAELFGSATVLSNGKRAANGFEALKEVDSNGDNIISSEDEDFAKLRLWVDLNGNAQSEKGEIFSLKKARVESISLSYVDMMEVDPFGNQTRQRSTFRRQLSPREQAQPLLIIDVWFNTLAQR